jgi:tetratricopeptide (TPR) repeat protein
MTEALYERYKEALRRGHIAALRGRHDAALTAYALAVALAPDRPLPHVSLGATYLRLGRAEEALASFDAALQRAASDETALAGRADALVEIGRPADAATSLDRLADLLDRSGRLAEACDIAGRALALAESRTRRRHVRELVGRLRASGPDDEVSGALARALQVLGRDGSARAPERTPASAEPTTSSPAGIAATGPEPEPLPPPTPADPVRLVAEAEAALERDDRATARARFEEAVRGHRALDQPNAALDAVARALTLDPLAPELHLVLAELYLERGWRTLAADKLVLLARLASSGGDDAVLAGVRRVAGDRLAEHEGLRSLLA